MLHIHIKAHNLYYYYYYQIKGTKFPILFYAKLKKTCVLFWEVYTLVVLPLSAGQFLIAF